MLPSKKRPTKGRSARQGGFSLVELLVVIGVIGVMAGISIPIMNPVRENARINKSLKNAQALAATAGAAQAAGAVLDLSSIDTAVAQLKDGVKGTGVFGTSTFRVAPFSAAEISEFRDYLAVDGNTLVFVRP
jgi:prepilin-type N-terminal cleavage/methylation domain-containing protein